MQRKVLGPFAAFVAAAMLGGCSPAAWLPSNESVWQDSHAGAKTPIVVKPSKLAFTGARIAKVSISESGYKGNFKVTIGDAKVAGFKGRTKGPSSKLKVIARGAGATVLTIADSQGHKVKVPISVTTSVVVVN